MDTRRLHIPPDELGRRSMITAGLLAVLALAAFVMGAVGAVSTFAFGALLLCSGIVELIDAQTARNTRGELRAGFTGLIPCLAGLYLVFQMGVGPRGAVLASGLFFLVNGIFRAAMAGIDRYPRWKWDAAYGLVAVILGIIVIAARNRISPSIVLGLVGIEFLFRAVALEGRNLAVRSRTVGSTTAP